MSIGNRAVLSFAAVLSGLAALGYELLWTRLLAASLGSQPLGVLGVLLGFFGGLALGALVWHHKARCAAHPLRLFAALELGAALFAIASPYILLELPTVLAFVAGPEGWTAPAQHGVGLELALTVVLAGLALLPATLCLGGTLPALVEAHRREGAAISTAPGGRSTGAMYAAHTFGATLGALGTVHVVLPLVGFAGGALVLAACAGVAALVTVRRDVAPRSADASPDARVDAAVDTSKDPDAELLREPWLIHVVLFATGCLGIGLEIVALAVLGQIFENTIYTFVHALAVYLVGTSLGAAVYARLARRAVAGRPATVAAALLLSMSVISALMAVCLAAMPDLLEALAPDGASLPTQILGELTVTAVAFGPAAIAMGMLFSHLTGLVAVRGLGRAYAMNTLGAAAAPLVFGIGVIPAFGYRDGVFAIVYGYLFVFAVFTWFRRFGPRAQLPAILGVMLLTATAPDDLVLVQPPDGWRIVEQRETGQGLVIVSENAQGHRRLQVGKHFRMGGSRAFGERRMGYLPLVLHPAPERALFLGVGTGATLGAVRDFDLESVDAVELLPDIIDVLVHFEDINQGVRNDDKVTFHAADARRFVASTTARYDVVVADLFHPGIEGAGRLYAREHFENIRGRLADDGLFAQWLPLHQLDAEAFATITATFIEVFPDAHAFLGLYNVGTPALALIGTKAPEGLQLDYPALARRLRAPVYRALSMHDPRDLLGAHLADADRLHAFTKGAPLNTDLHPVVMFAAPRTAYVEDTLRGWDNLRALVDADPHDGRMPRVPVARAPLEEIEAFHRALWAYLQGEALRLEHGGMPKQALAHYLTAYELAPEFAPARGMLFQVVARDLEDAEHVLARMLERTPDDPRVLQTYAIVLDKLGEHARARELRARLPRAPAP